MGESGDPQPDARASAGAGDTDLYEQFRAGDQTAFRRLVADHEPSLRARLALRIPASLQRRISVADVLQEAWVVAYRRRADYDHRGPGAFEPWVRGIAEKKLREEIRRHGGTAKRAAGREVTRGGRPDTQHFAGRARSPSEIAISAEEIGRIRGALAELSDDHRTIIGLALEQGLPLNEAAVAMGRSHDAAKKLYGRAMVQLRRVLAAREGDASP